MPATSKTPFASTPTQFWPPRRRSPNLPRVPAPSRLRKTRPPAFSALPPRTVSLRYLLSSSLVLSLFLRINAPPAESPRLTLAQSSPDQIRSRETPLSPRDPQLTP